MEMEKEAVERLSKDDSGIAVISGSKLSDATRARLDLLYKQRTAAESPPKKALDPKASEVRIPPVRRRF